MGTFNLHPYQEWHYDAVVLPFQRSSQGKKRKSGFDLSGRRPKPESSGKHKYAIPEAKVAPEVREYFLRQSRRRPLPAALANEWQDPRQRRCTGIPTANI